MDSKDNKPTPRGVYLDIEHSPICCTHNGKTYRFSSKKKLDMFNNKVAENKLRISKIQGMIFRYTGNGKDFNLDELYSGVYDKTYNEMLYK